jgi:hypothetical protein
MSTSAFARFQQAISLIGTIAILFLLPACPPPPHLAAWQHYPAIQPFKYHPHLLVVKCEFADAPGVRHIEATHHPAITDLDTLINQFLTIAGNGTGNVIDYYYDTSYGAMAMGSRVYGWYTSSTNKGTDRFTTFQKCLDAIPDSTFKEIDFNYYSVAIAVMNDSANSGASGYGRVAVTTHGGEYHIGVVVLDGDNMYIGEGAHEIGHGLGLTHSFDDSGRTNCPGVGTFQAGEYCDSYDMMSSNTSLQFPWQNYPAPVSKNSAGPGFNLPNLLSLDVLPPSRLVTYSIGSQKKAVRLAALSHPGGTDPLGIKIVGSNPHTIFTVEYRQADGWDQGLLKTDFRSGFQPDNVILIHVFKDQVHPYSYLIRSGKLIANGQSFSFLGFKVTLDSFYTPSGVAYVSVGPAS